MRARSSLNRASSSNDSRFRAIANTRRRTRFPVTTDITCKLCAFYRLESRSRNLLTMIGSNPTISDSFVRDSNGNQIARLKFGPRCSFLTFTVHGERGANVYYKKRVEKNSIIQYITVLIEFLFLYAICTSLKYFYLKFF